ncbi:hypothetical protein J6590_074735 [Homalodisca vitripennis]|nr:hypothetical protein J6590_074735 [Homalodisca vitripennis]
MRYWPTPVYKEKSHDQSDGKKAMPNLTVCHLGNSTYGIALHVTFCRFFHLWN